MSNKPEMLYAVTDENISIEIRHLPVLEWIDHSAGIPDEPCRVLPPKEVILSNRNKEMRATMGVDAAQVYSIAFRMALRFLDKRISETHLQLIAAIEKLDDMDSNYDPNNPEDRLKLTVMLDTLARATGVANDAIHDMREMVVRRMKRIINNAKKP